MRDRMALAAGNVIYIVIRRAYENKGNITSRAQPRQFPATLTSATHRCTSAQRAAAGFLFWSKLFRLSIGTTRALATIAAPIMIEKKKLQPYC